MSLTLTDQDKTTLRAAAYGAVTLLAAAGATGKPHKIATHGSIALASATGPIGHVLAEKSDVGDQGGQSVAEIADRALPALTDAMTLLKKHNPAEADNFRGIVLTALNAATGALKGDPSPILADMTSKITAALDAS